MSIQKTIIMLILTINFMSFIVSIWFVFVKKGKATIGLQLIKVFSVFCMVFELAAVSLDPLDSIFLVSTGILMLISSFGLYYWTVYSNRNKKLSLAFSPDLPEHLNKCGPYKWIRHPFYTSYLISYCAGFVVTVNYWLILVIVIMGLIYFDAARKEEKKFFSSQLNDEYIKYKRETGMFIPRLSGLL